MPEAFPPLHNMSDFFDENYYVRLTASRQSSAPDNEGQLTVDVFQDDEHIVIQSTIAGVSPEDIDISITNDMVTIKGVRQPEQKVRPQDYYYQELYWGPFSRSIILPVDIEADSAKAAMKNGILTIKLPKLERLKTKKVKITE